MLEEFAPSLYLADGPTVSFFGFPYPTRMAVARLASGGLWIWSPIALDSELERALAPLGPVHFLVSPNKLHHLFLAQWLERWPEAKLYGPPGLARRRPDLRFDAELGDDPDPAWAGEIDAVVFRGSFVMDEVVFHHRASRSALFCDLIQRHDPSKLTGWKGWLMRADGLAGEKGSTPREWRATFLRRAPARAARARVLGWRPQSLVVAHGACARSGAMEILTDALAWI